MIADPLRTAAYERALQGTVRPGAVVVDVGTGMGLFAVLAARLGARAVYAIESSDIIEVARGIAEANGCAGRIRFLHGDSTKMELPERADVVVSDLHGVLPFYQRHLATLIDARERFLAPGGRLIPRRDRIWAAGVCAAGLHRGVTTPWLDNPFGLDMSPAHAFAANRWSRAFVGAEEVATSRQCVAQIDFSTVQSMQLDATFRLEVARATHLHGLCVWFDSELADGISLSNAPGAPPLVYGTAFFPWPSAVAGQPGDAITVRLAARPLHGHYVWSWDSRVDRGSARVAEFRQSDFFSEPLAPDTVRRRAASHVAHVDDKARVDAAVLALMEENVALGDIARDLSERFPQRFARWQDALDYVADVSARYDRVP